MTRRVVVWGTGNVGRTSIRTVLAHADLELVDVIVHTPEKVGRDAGELADIGGGALYAVRRAGALGRRRAPAAATTAPAAASRWLARLCAVDARRGVSGRLPAGPARAAVLFPAGGAAARA